MARRPETHASNLEGRVLEGKKNGLLWTVGKKLEAKPTSGGTFSVCYPVTGKDQKKAFLKATDVSLLTHGAGALDPLQRIHRATSEHLFERQILDLCNGNRMDKIVAALDYGELEFEIAGKSALVFYIIFEEAAGDVRSSAAQVGLETPAWFLTALHNVAVAVSQLHRTKISHNDIKPSNVLVFDDLLQKLADMGRATADDISGPWDSVHCVGDYGYVPPEMWGYKFDPERVLNKITFKSRAPCDIYLLGSLAYFFLTGEVLTPVMRGFLRPQHRPQNWNEDFEAVLPFLLTAHEHGMDSLKESIAHDWDKKYHKQLLELVPIISDLTCPDPRRRGDPKNKRRNASIYDLQRIVSIFDRLSKQVSIR
ncbi:protein kinase domain-containing protein [Hyphomonas jannaschiana]|uniref:protein kinase domain-containing protein n=1 Tax=Hyphomonas jannaschiana TaxID=86 RepID=UPI0035C70E4D